MTVLLNSVPRAASAYMQIPVANVEPSPFQPRLAFEPAAMEELRNSIGELGVLEPVLVRAFKGRPGRYQLLAGERRWRACCALGREWIPAMVRETTDEEARIIGLSENIHREDLNIVDRAHALRDLKEALECTVEELSQRLGMTARNYYSLAAIDRLPACIKEGVREAGLATYHAQALVAFRGSPVQQSVLFEQLRARRPSKRQLAEVMKQVNDLVSDQTSDDSEQVIRDIVSRAVLDESGGGRSSRVRRDVETRVAASVGQLLGQLRALQDPSGRAAEVGPELRQGLQALVAEIQQVLG